MAPYGLELPIGEKATINCYTFVRIVQLSRPSKAFQKDLSMAYDSLLFQLLLLQPRFGGARNSSESRPVFVMD
jgi:hypothetical protein